MHEPYRQGRYNRNRRHTNRLSKFFWLTAAFLALSGYFGPFSYSKLQQQKKNLREQLFFYTVSLS
jgi:cell division protein FtsB